MKIEKGFSRIVFIFSEIVIKLPLFHIRYPIQYFFSKSLRQDPQKPKLSSYKDVLKYCFSGFYANRLEYLYSQSNKEAKGILHVKSLFPALILIQFKGEVLTTSDPRWRRIVKILIKRGVRDFDMLRSCNFCIFKNKLKLLDYGREETIDCLNQGGLSVIENILIHKTKLGT